MSMTFTLTCGCGAEVETKGDTFAEVKAAAEALGWSTEEPTCPDHATPDGHPERVDPMDGEIDG
ncbi:hypothetical protein [Nocardioides lacusdianchii]|uniref:hypothetical protein n=1 Tax=Nocardioides lacusdianchii TaxID=2783664 RepID=UPI001CCF95EA|nr:hypothetical protein [Nocardioides lacusdianchii]